MIAFLCINASSNLNGRVLDASEMEALLVK
jgi:hypothetical protein